MYVFSSPRSSVVSLPRFSAKKGINQKLQKESTKPLFASQGKVKSNLNSLDEFTAKTYYVGYFSNSGGMMERLGGQDVIDVLGQSNARSGKRWTTKELGEMLAYPPADVVDKIILDMSSPKVGLVNKGFWYHRLTELGKVACRLSQLPELRNKLEAEENLLKDAYIHLKKMQAEGVERMEAERALTLEREASSEKLQEEQVEVNADANKSFNTEA